MLVFGVVLGELIFVHLGCPGDYWDPFGGPLPSKTPSSAEVLRHLTSNVGGEELIHVIYVLLLLLQYNHCHH